MGSPPQYSPALRWVTTGFGMGPGGASTLSATGTPHPRQIRGRGSRHAPRGSCLAPGGAPTRPASSHHALPRPAERLPPPPGAGRSGAAHRPRIAIDAGDPPSTIRTARLQSVARGPPAAYQPGHLPGVLPRVSGDARLGEGFPLRCFQRAQITLKVSVADTAALVPKGGRASSPRRANPPKPSAEPRNPSEDRHVPEQGQQRSRQGATLRSPRSPSDE
jgi:hypothetical protein